MNNIAQRIATELGIKSEQVTATILLLDEGATVPFIARYRKEVTGGLDDTQLRTLHERLFYLRELEDRRVVILKSISEQNKLTQELEQAIKEADTKTRLEDLYLPYKPKRRTKAQIAREAGLLPLAEILLTDANVVPESIAISYLNPEHNISDAKTALEGARHILMERFAEEAELLGNLRQYLWDNGVLTARVIPGKEDIGIKFKDYFEYEETIKTIPSHRALALFRGRNENILQINLSINEEPHPCESKIAQQFHIQNLGRPADAWLQETVRWAWRVKIATHLEVELLSQLREIAETEAIQVFGKNLQDLLLAAPAGTRVTMGLDPGLRTGVKVAIVDATGKLLDTATVYPHPPKQEWQQSILVLAHLCQQHKVSLISIGNGTASRETDKLVIELIKQFPHLHLTKLVVSEAGASVYSASELAAKEFPSIDVSLRGAISIARRLQDPLAELVKIDPKAIGVGQYQHDVNQNQLAKKLDSVIETCVNAVGVDVNTASIPLLSRVSGLNETIARNIVKLRDEAGAFQEREALKKVPRLGDKAFEQAAGFLRINNGANPLDTSAVHPEAYPIVEKILKKYAKTIKEVIGDTAFIKKLNPVEFTDEKFGVPTVADILKELEKPGRDPRPEFKTATFQEDVTEIKDLKPGMILEGVITNVTNFGAFVDIGVHQDGLVHISAITHKFISDPREIIKAGDIVKVKVIDIDLKRSRIALTMRLDDRPAPSSPKETSATSKKPPKMKAAYQPTAVNTTMASAFAKLKKEAN